MTTTQTLLEIAALAAGAVGRQLAPATATKTKTVAAKTVATVKKVATKPKPAPQPFAMYDAVTVTNIPAGAAAVAGYVDGYNNAAELRKRFPKAKLLTLTVMLDTAADGIDYEKGTATLAECVTWICHQVTAGRYKPVFYASRSNMPAAWAALTTAGIKRDQVRLWVADWTGELHIPTGYDACQWLGGVDAPYDESLCNPGFLR